MKTLKTLQTLPLILVLATGLSLAPAASMAGNNDRGPGKDRIYQKQDGRPGHSREGYRSRHPDPSHIVPVHGQKRPSVRRAYDTHHGHGQKHRRHEHRKYGHHHGHGHFDKIIVHDHRHYDPFRLHLGLYFDNLHILYRDY